MPTDPNANANANANAQSTDFDPAGFSKAVDASGQRILDDAAITSLSKFKGPFGDAKLAKSYLEMERARSTDLRLPGANSKPEDLAEFHTKVSDALGRPKTADAYKFQLPADWPAEISMNAELETAFRGLLAKHRIAPDVAQELYGLYNGYVRQVVEADVAAKSKEALAAKAQLIADAGSEALFKGQLARVQRRFAEVAKDLGIEEKDLVDALTSTGFGNNVVLFKVLAEMAAVNTPMNTPRGQTGTAQKNPLQSVYEQNT